jgi:hypothetical protein
MEQNDITKAGTQRKRPARKNEGRPKIQFNPEWHERLIKHCSTGLSFEAFAGVIGVSVDTLYQWLKTNNEFSDTKKIADAKCRYFWEAMAIANLKNKNFQTGTWIFNMKNRFGWRDVQELRLPEGTYKITIGKNKQAEKS